MEKALKIDSEFAELIPAPDAEELKWLEESIKKEGCTDPLIVWNGTIIDGHNRYNICTRLGIPFSYREKEDLSDRNEVKAWIIERQLSRRNLTKYQKSKLALKYEPLLKEQAKDFIDRIESDLKLIETFTDLKAEILVEYKKSLNVSDAITGVKARAKAVQEEQARQAAEAEKRAAEAQRVEAIKAAIPEAPAAVEAPTEQTAAPAPEKKYCIRFTVKGTKEQLIALKKFLNEGEYEYE